MPSYSPTRARYFQPSAEDWTWRVVDPTHGGVVAEVTTPPGLFPGEIGRSWVLGVGKDELDRPSVRLHGLTRRPLASGRGPLEVEALGGFARLPLRDPM